MRRCRPKRDRGTKGQRDKGRVHREPRLLFFHFVPLSLRPFVPLFVSMSPPKPSRHDLMHQLAVVRAALREYRIRDAPDYAEVLIAEALAGKRVPSPTNQGYDVVCERYGRIEVKCRQLPPDGRVEERVEVLRSKESGFDFLAIVIFHADFAVSGAVVIPYDSVWELIARKRYNRISFSQACGLRGAIDVADRVRDAARW